MAKENTGNYSWIQSQFDILIISWLFLNVLRQKYCYWWALEYMERSVLVLINYKKLLLTRNWRKENVFSGSSPDSKDGQPPEVRSWGQPSSRRHWSILWLGWWDILSLSNQCPGSPSYPLWVSQSFRGHKDTWVLLVQIHPPQSLICA